MKKSEKYKNDLKPLKPGEKKPLLLHLNADQVDILRHEMKVGGINACEVLRRALVAYPHVDSETRARVQEARKKREEQMDLAAHIEHAQNHLAELLKKQQELGVD